MIGGEIAGDAEERSPRSVEPNYKSRFIGRLKRDKLTSVKRKHTNKPGGGFLSQALPKQL